MKYISLNLKEQSDNDIDIATNTKNNFQFHTQKFHKKPKNYCLKFLSSLIPFNPIFFPIVDNSSDIYGPFLVYTSLSFLFSGLIIKRKFFLFLDMKKLFIGLFF